MHFGFLWRIALHPYGRGDRYFVADHQSIVWADKLAYPLASVIVMLGISLVADWFYTKHEPLRKTGASNVIMLLHMVPLNCLSRSGRW